MLKRIGLFILILLGLMILGLIFTSCSDPLDQPILPIIEEEANPGLTLYWVEYKEMHGE